MRKNQCPVLKNLHFSFRTFIIMIMTILVGSLKRGFSECPSCPTCSMRQAPGGCAPGGCAVRPRRHNRPARARAGYKNPKIDPRLLDPKFAFEELQDARKVRRAENDMAGHPAALE